jgi:acyl-CoA synthetase (NDP forming)
MSPVNLDFLFSPKSVALIGASTNPSSFGFYFMEHFKNYGYKGDLYPINPKSSEIMGIKAYPGLDQVPGNVDYVICCIALTNIPAILDQCRQKGVKVLHVFSGRGAETGRPEAVKLENEILRLGKEYDIRLLGPNCLGVYCPQSGLSFGYDFPVESGTVGAMIQSGGNATDAVRFSALRGIKFSKVVSYGNALDINQNDLLEYFEHDDETKILLCYLEGLKGNSREFLTLLKETAKRKVVIVLKAGRTMAGARQTLSHTASLAGSGKIFETAIRQAGAIPVRNLDEMINQAVAFYYLPPIRGIRVGLGGGGGGRNALSADEWEENGFEIPPMPQEVKEYWKEKGSQLWDWLSNPVDFSITPGDPCNVTDTLIQMGHHPVFDFIVATVTEDLPFAREAFLSQLSGDTEGYLKIKEGMRKAFLVIFSDRPLGIDQLDDWRWRAFAECRTRLVNSKIPVFTNINQAAKAVRELINYYNNREN